jgi:hypothetical protein
MKFPRPEIHPAVFDVLVVPAADGRGLSIPSVPLVVSVDDDVTLHPEVAATAAA